MLKHRFKRLTYIVIMLSIISAGVFYILRAMQQQIQLYLTPSELLQQKKDSRTFQLGGMVNGVSYNKVGVGVWFYVTDFTTNVKVYYSGILPALFKDKKGVVVLGKWHKNYVVAKKVLAKHDENYQPPKIQEVK